MAGSNGNYSRYVYVYNKTRETFVATEAAVADSYLRRLIGLLGKTKRWAKLGRAPYSHLSPPSWHPITGPQGCYAHSRNGHEGSASHCCWWAMHLKNATFSVENLR